MIFMILITLISENGRKFSEVILPWYPIRVQESKRD